MELATVGVGDAQFVSSSAIMRGGSSFMGEDLLGEGFAFAGDAPLQPERESSQGSSSGFQSSRERGEQRHERSF
jgi:hypothetical protein